LFNYFILQCVQCHLTSILTIVRLLHDTIYSWFYPFFKFWIVFLIFFLFTQRNFIVLAFVSRWQMESRCFPNNLGAVIVAFMASAKIVSIAHTATVGEDDALVHWLVVRPSRKAGIAGTSIRYWLITGHHCVDKKSKNIFMTSWLITVKSVYYLLIRLRTHMYCKMLTPICKKDIY